MKGSDLPNPVLILFLLLLPRDASATAKPQYLVVVPSQLYSGVPEKACIMLNHLNETMTLNMTLEYGTQTQALLSDLVTEKDSFYCSPFMIPELPTSSAFITVQVKGLTQEFKKRKAMEIMKVESLVFVQTDKPVYKPGQTVRFRIVSMDVNFLPLNETFPVVYIENPKRNRIFQWQSLTLQGGLSQLSFPLSVEPALGPYNVIVQKESGTKVKHSFEVNEYVLPKFEVQLKMPKTISFLDETFEITACGLYTYGKPVPGLVTINVCRKYPYSYSYCTERHSQSICEEFSQQADSKGCFTQLVKTKLFQLKLKGYGRELQVEATIREEGTGLKLTRHGSCKITNTLSKLVFKKVDSYYRRGLPFFGQVLLVDEKDRPLPNKTLTVTLDRTAHHSHFTTNEHGLATISIDTTNLTSSSIMVTVIYKQDSDCFDDQWLEEIHSQAQQTIQHVFSPSKSYVHLELVAGTIACGKTQEIQVHYILNGQTVKDEKELTFYYLIKARGSISQSGIHVLSIEQGNMNGVFSFSFQVESDIAPTAQLFLYTILPDGEIVADTQELEIENCFANKLDILTGRRTNSKEWTENMKKDPECQMTKTVNEGDLGSLISEVKCDFSRHPAKYIHHKNTAQRKVSCKVNLGFSSAQSLPASDTNLKVTATPQSLCALRAIDQSMLLLKPEAELSPQSVYNLLPVKNRFNAQYGHNMNEDEEGCISAEDITHNGILYTPKQIWDDNDVYSIFQSAGLNIFTNSKVHKPYLCQPPEGFSGLFRNTVYDSAPSPDITVEYDAPSYPMMMTGAPPPAEAVQQTVRKYFPETWIWDLVPLDSSGNSKLAVKVPDTITEWKASALCLSGKTGLGLSPIISLQVFQPFFLELTLPYSVVRGEAFTLKATVFNYLSYCIRVSIELEDSPAFLAVPVKKNEESHCVCGDGRKTMSWAVTLKSLGKVNFTATAEALQSAELCDNELPRVPALGHKDTVVKPLLVEPEGIEKEETFNSLLCATETGEPEKLSLKLPSNVVEGSARATYSVLGDILGSAMQNLQNLLRMPYGCGEQNMVLFVPNIYVLNYLNETGQLTKKIKSKAISHLISGYQRQLNYKHSDGSYSTFGDRGGTSQGNTWLTAFVLKSFSQARSYIFVEDSHIMDALTWLSKKQKENGCFQHSGSLLNNAMKGGVDDEVTLSAYITIALLEMPLPVTHPIVRNALFCLESAWASTSEAQGSLVYAKALLAYAFALAGNQAKRSELLQSLDKEAVKEEDSIHLQRPGKHQEAKTFYYQPRAPSAEVEMTSYLLLAYLTSQPAPSSEDLSMASHIVKWITKQQNPNGGFSSTQDTVVALQALSKYGAATFTKREKAATVTIKSSETFSEELHVDEANRLLLQELALSEVPGEYRTTVSGSGCVYLQTSLRYNVLPKKEGKAPFILNVDTLPKDCDGVDAHRKFQIHINISYTGERPSSNMVIVDVKMVSGFIPVKPSVKKLQEKPHIQRTEVSTNHVLIYFEELTKQALSFSFAVEQDIQVENLKPATVKAYDYYETDEFTIEEYSAPCSTESKLGNA